MARSAKRDPSRNDSKALKTRLRRLEAECEKLRAELGKPDAADAKPGVAGRPATAPSAQDDRSAAFHRQIAGILDMSADAIISIDDKGLVWRFNRGAEDIFGYRASEIIGRPLDILIPKRFRRKHRGNLASFGKSRKASRLMNERGEIYGLRKDGGEFPGEASIARLDMPGRPIFTVILRDISDRRKAEEALRANEALLNSVIENLPAAAHIKSVDGRYIMVNREYERLFGLSGPALKGRTIEEMYPAQVVDQAVEHDRLVLEGMKTMEREFVIGEGPDTRYFLTIKTPVLDADGKAAAILCVETEITERKRADMALRERESQLTQAQRMAKLGDFVWDDVADQCLHCSDELAGLFGMSAAEFIEQRGTHEKFISFVHPDDREPIERSVAEAIEKKIPYDIEFRCYGADGELIHLRETGEPMLYDEGRQIRTFGTMQDITSIRETEEALRKSESELRQAQRQARIGTFIWDEINNVCLHCSDELARLIGTTPEEFLAQRGTMDTFMAFVVEEDRPMVYENLKSEAEHGATYDIEYRCRDADGEIHYFREIGKPITDDDGARVRTFGTIQDVTDIRRTQEALRQSEQQLRTIADNLPAFIAYTDKDERLLFANRTAGEWYADEPENIVGKKASEILGEETYKKIKPRFDEVLSGKNVRVEEYRLFPDGEERYVDAANIPDFDDRGEVRGWFSLIQDIAERKRAEDVAKRNMHSAELRHRIATAANAASGVEEAFQVCIDEICGHAGWPIGHVFRQTDDNPDEFVSADIWHLDDPEKHRSFYEATREARFAPGEGLPGRVAVAGEPCWIEDIESDPNCTGSKRVTDLTVRSAFAFPVIVDGKPAAVLEFFTDTPQPADGLLMDVAAQAGNILGRVIERRRAEQALRDSEQQIRMIADNLPVSIAYVDKDRRFRFVNRTAEKWYARPAADIVGQKATTVVEKGSAEKLWPHVRKALAGTAARFEETRTFSDGVRRIVDSTYIPDIGENGDVRGFFALVQDITERKAAEQALRDSESLTRLVTDNLPVFIAYADKDERYRFINKTAERWYNLAAADVAGKTILEVIGADAYAGIRPHIHAALAGEGVQFEVRRDFPDGSEKVIDVTYVPDFDEQNQVRGLFALINDITERQKASEALRDSEERFRAMIENSPSAVFLKDLDGRYRLANKRYSEWIGVPVADMLGKTPRQFLPRKDYVDEYEALDQEVLENLQPVQRTQKAIFPDGSIHSLEAVKFPVYDSEGRLTGVGGFLTDITDRLQAEEQLRQAQKMEAVGKLTGGVAHDFNNLLAVILGNAELLREEHGAGDPAIEAVTNATRRGAELTQRLLSFSRQLPLQPAAVGVGALVDGMADMLRRTLGEKVEIETRAEGEPWQAQADPGQLENAILNIALNAHHAMPDGGKLRIETENVTIGKNSTQYGDDAAPGEFVKLFVSDTGRGMTADVLARVFEPFFTTKEVGEGSGLGLSMVYGFARQSGGFVTVDSVENQGTVVCLYLPRARGRKPMKARRPAGANMQGHGESVLVVEDDPDVRKLTVALLKSLGYKVLEAEDGETAEQVLARDCDLDLLLSDVVLPGNLSGLDIADMALKRRPDLKILFMSGYAEDVLRRQESDPDNTPRHDLLTKPFSRADLSRKVRETLESSRAAAG